MTGGELLKRYGNVGFKGWDIEIMKYYFEAGRDARAGKFPIPLTDQQKAVQKAVRIISDR